MTEEAYFRSAVQGDYFNELDVEQYEIVATLDSHASDICRSLDGKVFPMKDFGAGVMAPPFHYGVTYFEDDFGQPGERVARGKEGKTYYVPADMTYEAWKKTFVNGGDKSELKEIIPMEKSNDADYNIRTREELEKVANDVKVEISNYVYNSLKWCGKISIDNSLTANEAIGQKEWNCNITLIDTADDGAVWHEMLHSCPTRYYVPSVYTKNQYIEEASVEFLKQQICKEKKVVQSSTYDIWY